MKTNPRTEAVAKAIDKARDRVMESSSEPNLERMNIALAQAAEKALIEALMEPGGVFVQGLNEKARENLINDRFNSQRQLLTIRDVLDALLAAGGDGDG